MTNTSFARGVCVGHKDFLTTLTGKEWWRERNDGKGEVSESMVVSEFPVTPQCASHMHVMHSVRHKHVVHSLQTKAFIRSARGGRERDLEKHSEAA